MKNIPGDIAHYDEPNQQVDYYRDPIHNYIAYTTSDSDEVTEKNIITSKWVQRLRRVFQLQCAWLVYPGAKHSRFLHVIGVMHLAGKFASHLWETWVKNVGPDSIPSKHYVVETCRLAGLLHDVGHGPMGHTLDEIYAKAGYDVTHEDIGRGIITEKLADQLRQIKRSPEGKFEEEIDPQVIADLIKLPSGQQHKHEWCTVFAKLIHGLYCVDILDYLMRDSYFCGTREYGSVDVDRFMYSTFVSPNKELTLHKNCMSALKSFLYSRYFMYENIYYHHKVRAFDFSFEELFRRSWDHIGVGNPVENLEKFFTLDDYFLYSIPNLWAESEDEEMRTIAGEWDRILNTNVTWKCVYEMQYFPKDTLSKLFCPEDVEQKITDLIYSVLDNSEDIRIDIPFLSVRPENIIRDSAKNISIYDPHKNSYEPMSISGLTDEIPFRMMIIRVYSRANCDHEKVRDAVMRALNVDGYRAKTSF
jgi:HD superfamily phosphohydrolase